MFNYLLASDVHFNLQCYTAFEDIGLVSRNDIKKGRLNVKCWFFGVWSPRSTDWWHAIFECAMKVTLSNNAVSYYFECVLW